MRPRRTWAQQGRCRLHPAHKGRVISARRNDGTASGTHSRAGPPRWALRRHRQPQAGNMPWALRLLRPAGQVGTTCWAARGRIHRGQALHALGWGHCCAAVGPAARRARPRCWHCGQPCHCRLPCPWPARRAWPSHTACATDAAPPPSRAVRWGRRVAARARAGPCRPSCTGTSATTPAYGGAHRVQTRLGARGARLRHLRGPPGARGLAELGLGPLQRGLADVFLRGRAAAWRPYSRVATSSAARAASTGRLRWRQPLRLAVRASMRSSRLA